MYNRGERCQGERAISLTLHLSLHTSLTQNWENIHRDELTTQVGDLIDVSIDVYKRWKLTYEDELNLVGINDHRLIDGLMLLFKEYLPTFEENSYTISRILERSLSSNLKKYGKKQHFEHFLDILQLS